MDARDVRHVGVVGCGLMGSGIAEVCARAGVAVTVVESTEALAEAGRERIARSLGAALARGKLSAEDEAAARGRIQMATDLGALADTELVIEAATEDPDAKRAIFARLGEVTRPDAVLASNTSSIPIATLAVASGRPTLVVGMHFFNPVPVMPLVELTPSDSTSLQTYALVESFGGEVLGKTCVRSSDEAGFIVNRLLIPYLYDAIRLCERGFATREDIDTAVQSGLAHPMGPLRLADLIGLDTVFSIGEVLRAAFGGDRYEAPALLRTMIAEGRLGKKSGAGFYDYG
jgi:3-hydroxybutyryl-CoA dehydrogenase